MNSLASDMFAASMAAWQLTLLSANSPIGMGDLGFVAMFGGDPSDPGDPSGPEDPGSGRVPGRYPAKTDNLANPHSAFNTICGTLQRYSFEPAITYEITLKEIYIGAEANSIVAYENMFYKKPNDNQQWVLMRYNLKNTGSELLEAKYILYEDWFFTSSGASAGVASMAVFCKDRKGHGIFDTKLYPGASSDVWYGILIDKSVGYPYLQLCNGWNAEKKTFNVAWANTDPNYVYCSTYNISYQGNGAASGTMANSTSVRYLADFTLPANTFRAKTGYRFAGWNTKADGTGATYAYRASVKNLAYRSGAVVTLYAQWKPTAFKIGYHLNGGTNNAENPLTYTFLTPTFVLKYPTRTGYVFGGWYANSDLSGTRVTRIPKGSTGTKHLYAKWVEKKS